MKFLSERHGIRAQEIPGPLQVAQKAFHAAAQIFVSPQALAR
jgi:hypothetical protein